MTEPDGVHALLEREAIRDLVSAYCYRIAAADLESVLALFAEDCVVDILGDRHRGHEGLRALYVDSFAVEPKPFAHNHLVELIDARQARGRAVFEIRQTRDGARETSVGCYQDEYVKSEGVWKFGTRRFAFY